MPIFPYRLNVRNLLCFHTVIMVAWLLAVHYSSELGHLEADIRAISSLMAHLAARGSEHTAGPPQCPCTCTGTRHNSIPHPVSPTLGTAPPSLGVIWLTLSCLFNLFFINTSIKEEMKFRPTERTVLLLQTMNANNIHPNGSSTRTVP